MRYSAVAVLLAVPMLACAQKPLPPAQQIALAVLPLPAPLRAGASVLGYNPAGKLVALRTGKGEMTCLASDPKDTTTFHVACYHNSMEPFMARGRELRAQGADTRTVEATRFAEAGSGKLAVPKQAAALWMLTGPWKAVDAKAGTVTSEVKPMYVVYTPYATSASTGLLDQPVGSGPWLMDAGTAKAHIMFTQSMEP
jgi:hypothetical protein